MIDEPGAPIDHGPQTPALNSCRRAARAPTPAHAARAAPRAPRTHVRAALGAMSSVRDRTETRRHSAPHTDDVHLREGSDETHG